MLSRWRRITVRLFISDYMADMGAYKKEKPPALNGFSLSGFDCPSNGCCFLTYIDCEFLQKLKMLSCILGDIKIISGYRCEKSAEKKDSMHCLGKAADITAKSENKRISSHFICYAAQECGFSGIIRKDEYTVHIDTRQGTKFFYDIPKKMYVRDWG